MCEPVPGKGHCGSLKADGMFRMGSLLGQLLVSSPALQDPNFAQTIVLMVQHNEQGALGLILNRPTDTTISEAWQQVRGTPCTCQDRLHHGGPCEGPLMVVHVHESVSQLEVLSGVYFSTDRENIEWLIEQNDDPIKFYVGCSGWAPGQLESELKTGSWLTIPATFEHVFEAVEDQWLAVTKQIARSIASSTLNPRIVPEDPSLN